MEKRIVNLSEDLKKEALDFLKEIVRIPTENPPGMNYEKITSVIANKLEEFGYKVDIISPNDDELKKLVRFGGGKRPNVVGTLGNGNIKVAFNAHYDVVPAGDGWSVDPYAGIVKDGRLYGRGSADMKSGLAAQIFAVEALRRTKLLPSSLQVIQTIVPDEETVGNINAGTYYLIQKGVYKGIRYVIFTEPSGPDNLAYGHRGAIWAIVKVFGKKSHGGLPQLGIDAVRASIKMINKLYESLPDTTSAYNIIPDVAKKPSILVGTLKCGTWMNTVADYCEFGIVRRLIPEENLGEVRENILKILEEVSKETGVRYDYDEFYSVDTVSSDYNDKLYRIFTEKVKEVRKISPGLVLLAGTFDMRFTVKEGIVSINYGPGKIELAHATDEYVELKDFYDSIQVLAEVLKVLGNE